MHSEPGYPPSGLKVLATMVGAGLAAVVVIGGSGWLFAWLYTVFFPDRSTSATDLYGLAVIAAAVVGVIVGIVLVVGLALWLGVRRTERPAV